MKILNNPIQWGERERDPQKEELGPFSTQSFNFLKQPNIPFSHHKPSFQSLFLKSSFNIVVDEPYMTHATKSLRATTCFPIPLNTSPVSLKPQQLSIYISFLLRNILSICPNSEPCNTVLLSVCSPYSNVLINNEISFTSWGTSHWNSIGISIWSSEAIQETLAWSRWSGSIWFIDTGKK